jgi:hypothetical protein
VEEADVVLLVGVSVAVEEAEVQDGSLAVEEAGALQEDDSAAVDEEPARALVEVVLEEEEEVLVDEDVSRIRLSFRLHELFTNCKPYTFIYQLSFPTFLMDG